jgi:hypothetical protein
MLRKPAQRVPITRIPPILLQQMQIDCTIGIAVQNKPSPILPLRHMMGYPYCYHACQSCHSSKLLEYIPSVPEAKEVGGQAGVIRRVD